MSSSAINAQLFQAKIGSIQNQADSTSVYSNGVWSFKNSTAVTSVTITDAGNVGVGVTPSAWGSGSKAIELGARASLFFESTGGNFFGIANNSYYDGANYRYKQTAGVGQLNIGSDGSFTFFNAASGTAGNTITPTERMRLDASGRLLVNPSLTHNGTAGIVSANGFGMRAGTGGASSNVFNINWTGSAAQLWIDNVNNGTISLTSDYRVKKNIETQELPALERIAQLRPVKYEYTDYKELFKADGVQREGFIAHELQAVIPSAVEGQKDDENQIQSLKLDALCSVMVKAIQEQQAQIEALKAEVAALKAQP